MNFSVKGVIFNYRLTDLETTRDEERREKSIRGRKAKALKGKLVKKPFRPPRLKEKLIEELNKKLNLDTFELELNRASALFFYIYK